MARYFWGLSSVLEELGQGCSHVGRGRAGAGLEANSASCSGAQPLPWREEEALINPGLSTQCVFHQKLLKIWSNRRIKAAPYLGLQRVQPLTHVSQPGAVHAF